MRKGKVLNMQELIVNESPRRRTARRIGAAGVALAALFTLTACHEARGGGQIDEPAQGGVIPVDIDGAYQGEANFGFTFTCDVNTKAKRAEIKGQITYHDTGTSVINVPVDPDEPLVLEPKPFPEIRIHGIVDPFFVEGVLTCEEVPPLIPGTARFGGTYRSQDTSLSAMPPGRFSVGVFDQGEPGVSRDGIDGDGFSIQLAGGPPTYNGYTRAGYIEGGNIQVDPT